jgi:flagellar motility protein MotE (MotC chaperone)
LGNGNGGIMKILIMTIVSVACFAGYVVVFGMAFGINPSQMTHVFGAQQPVAAVGGKDLKADSTAVLDSTSLAENSEKGDSTAAVGPITEKGTSDSLYMQMADIKREKSELQKLKTEVTTLLREKSKADSLQLGNLAKMYDGVEPAQLAQVMSNMDDSLVIAILPRLKAQKAGKILERMPADRAARISSKLLGYN